MYLEMKILHVSAVTLSIGLFAYRGLLMLRRSEQLDSRVWRTLPHVVDTILLASGLGLVFYLGGAPLQEPWLQFKLALIMLYIFVGAVALRYGKTYKIRIAALMVALLLVLLIVVTALGHAPPGL